MTTVKIAAQVALAVCAAFTLAACRTTGQADITYPDGTRANLTFQKGWLDDMDVPGPDPVTGKTAAYFRVGPSPVAANAMLQAYRETGEGLRRYAAERAAQNIESD